MRSLKQLCFSRGDVRHVLQSVFHLETAGRVKLVLTPHSLSRKSCYAQRIATVVAVSSRATDTSNLQ